MVKTTPAGTGSRLLPLTQPTPADRHQPTALLHVVFAPAAECERARAGIRPASSAVGCRARRWTEA
jgi:hypothetical protein